MFKFEFAIGTTDKEKEYVDAMIEAAESIVKWHKEIINDTINYFNENPEDDRCNNCETAVDQENDAIVFEIRQLIYNMEKRNVSQNNIEAFKELYGII